MTSREVRLRKTIDTLRDSRDEARAERDEERARYETLKATVTEGPRRDRPRFGRCGFCGRPTYGRACDVHLEVEHELQEELR